MFRSLSRLASSWRSGFVTEGSTNDDQFEPEDIVRIVAAGELGGRVGDVCAAENLPQQLYYVWKVKYSGLTAAEVRDRRERERRKMSSTGVVLSGLVGTVIISVFVLIVSRTADSHPSAAASRPDNPVQTSQATEAARADSAPPSASTAAPAPSPVSTPNVAAVSVPRPVSPPAISATAPGISTTSTTPAFSTIADEIKRDTESVATVETMGYPVQVAAVPGLDEAHAWQARLKDAGYTSYVTTRTIDLIGVYRVRVGPLKSRQEAQAVAERLEHDGFPTWIVIP